MIGFNVSYGWAAELGYINNRLRENREFHGGNNRDFWLPGGISVWEFTGRQLRDNLIVADPAGLCQLVEVELNRIAPQLDAFFDSHFPAHPASVFKVQLTRYGTGGEAEFPDIIHVDIFQLFPTLQQNSLPRPEIQQLPLADLGAFAAWIAIHEMIHLYIDGDVRAAGLNAQDKRPQQEWLVDEILMCDELQTICPGNWRQYDSVSPPKGVDHIQWKKKPTWS